MKHSWSEFYQDCDNVANVTIVCRDGLLNTHKLILANISELTEKLIKEIPAADEVTLYLHQFSTLGVNLFLREPENDPELSTIFGRDLLSSNLKTEENAKNSSISLCKTEIYAEEDKEFDNLETESLKFENPKMIRIKQRSKMKRNSRYKIIQKETGSAKIKTEETLQEDINVEEMEDSNDDNIGNQDSEEVLDVEEYYRNVEETIKKFEEEIITKPLTEKHRILNAKIVTKIRMERALADLKTGRVKSARAAAKIYGVAASTLRKLRRLNISYQGMGRKHPKYITAEEEKHIKARLLDLSNNGKDMTMDLVKRIVTEEYEILKVNFPERKPPLEELQNKLYQYIRNFSIRHNLKDLCDVQLKEEREARRNFECEICQSSFTFKNVLVSHQRKQHSFLFS